MKLNTLFVLAVCTSTLMSSCVFKTAQENQFRYTHTSLVDGDAFVAIQHVNETAINGIKLAELVSNDGKSQNTSSSVTDFYSQFLVQLDSISNKFDVILNPVPSPVMKVTSVVDSVEGNTEVIAETWNYDQEAKEGVLFVKGQLERLSSNTNEDLQVFAKKQLALANELYSQVWGNEPTSN